ncbi:ATP-dependent zinc protease family protein [Thiomicrorhabdus cannonii]|uniref:ATP-dependent zinc protease family protein n=1 Tax=Thiomicrorhabdus cannonii TaxID=2748011 RepID=UPI0015BEEE3D|nr:RimK/LysX family protein [Thiomicrorhabdus cannonii]
MQTARLWLAPLFLLLYHTPLYAETDVAPMPAETSRLGWLEQARLEGLNDTLEAKIDSGADHSALHAEHIDYFQSDGQIWVRFTTVQQTTLRKPLLRESRIKQKNAASQRRPVVRLRLCLNGQWREVEVNLVNRSQFKQPLLIGRSALLRGELIDVQQTHLTQPNCSQQNQEN